MNRMFMNQSKIIIYGIGRLSELVSFFLNEETNYNIHGYCIDNEFKKDIDTFNELPLIDFKDIINIFPPTDFQLFIAIGNNYLREKIFSEAREKGYSMISHINKSVTSWHDLQYGENVLISGMSGIQPLVKIGENTIIIGSKIGHHSEIGNHVLLSCTTLGGSVKVGDYSFLGLNSSVQQNIVIAEKNIIGMGCHMDRDTKENEVYTNKNTAEKRSLSSDQIKEKYL